MFMERKTLYWLIYNYSFWLDDDCNFNHDTFISPLNDCGA